MNSDKLTFAKGNAKLSGDTAIFSLPAGFTCPGALLCLSRANQQTGKITDGKQTQFRCYAASAEALFKNIRVSRWNNFEALQAAKDTMPMVELILRSLPRNGVKLVRIHGSGDFYSQAYFDAWLSVAKARPELIFYCYTKALSFWIARLGDIPRNFKIVASRGGRFDALIDTYKLRSVHVVFSEKEAKAKKLPLDHDDTHVWKLDGDFALLIHGTQPAGSEAGRMAYALRQQGKGGYKADYFKHANKGN